MYIRVKSIVDRMAGIFLLLVFWPFLLCFGLVLFLLDPGPIFFRQRRLGLKGDQFDIWKFRTMIVNAEHVGSGLNSKVGDPRVTRVGRVYRGLSIDELPQIFNLIRGDISLVGPRPPVEYSPMKYDMYPEDIKMRFEVKPGITGWAQIHGRNSLSWEQKWEYDRYYVQNISFSLDVKILIRTVWVVLSKSGEYDE